MQKRTFIVNGSTHIDLAWKWGPEEMTEMLEVLVVRILDALETDPTFKYTLEQAAHYRTLERTRPDLVQRLGPYVRNGRLEMAGCMASTLDTNLPSGESFVRNQLLGIGWVKQNWGVEPEVGWLVDTFGINAQVPQILRQFGMRHLVANRLGGDKQHDAFVARGLDGSTVTLIGRDVYSPTYTPKFMSRGCYYHWDGIDQIFADADALPGYGPFIVHQHNENESLLSLRPYRDVRERNLTRPNESWTIGTHAEYFRLLEESGADLPIEHGDLNPEFTGCFSLRAPLRLRNRQAEGLLVEAEKWACLSGYRDVGPIIESWWNMAFVQFHDVFTGSHPTHVYRRVIDTLDQIDARARQVFDASAEQLLKSVSLAKEQSDTPASTIVAFNGLPWVRHTSVELHSIDVTRRIESVTDTGGNAVPFEVQGEALVILPTLVACGATSFVVRQSTEAPVVPCGQNVPAVSLSNAFLKVDLSAALGLERIVHGPTGRVMVQSAGGLLVVQQDDGNFQIETPKGAEVPASAGDMKLQSFPSTDLGQRAILSGRYSSLPWAGTDARLDWSVEFSLAPQATAVQLVVRFDWKGEGTRIRLRLPSTIDTAEGIYEVPFGTVKRKPYGVRSTARGEWPAQRFVIVEDTTHGIALVNKGAAGVEVIGGAMVTSLVRAPKSVYAGMLPDQTSAGHGQHRFDFSIVPYAGPWVEASVLRVAQELNTPVLQVLREGTHRGACVASQLSIEPSNVVLSTIKQPEATDDNSIIVRVYESAGLLTVARLRVVGMVSCERSDLRENRGTLMPTQDDCVQFQLKPYEIVTLRVTRQRCIASNSAQRA